MIKKTKFQKIIYSFVNYTTNILTYQRHNVSNNFELNYLETLILCINAM